MKKNKKTLPINRSEKERRKVWKKKEWENEARGITKRPDEEKKEERNNKIRRWGTERTEEERDLYIRRERIRCEMWDE